MEAEALVFVVDDDASLRTSLQDLLESVGLRVAVCASAQDFLRRPRPEGPSCLVLVDAAPFEAATWASTFGPESSLPGRVWASRAPVCIPDVVQDPGLLRALLAARAGLHAACGFPIVLGGDVLGVIEVFSPAVRHPDLVTLMATLGSQTGQCIERQRAEEALRQAQAELAYATRIWCKIQRAKE